MMFTALLHGSLRPRRRAARSRGGYSPMLYAHRQRCSVGHPPPVGGSGFRSQPYPTLQLVVLVLEGCAVQRIRKLLLVLVVIAVPAVLAVGADGPTSDDHPSSDPHRWALASRLADAHERVVDAARLRYRWEVRTTRGGVAPALVSAEGAFDVAAGRSWHTLATRAEELRVLADGPRLLFRSPAAAAALGVASDAWLEVATDGRPPAEGVAWLKPGLPPTAARLVDLVARPPGDGAQAIGSEAIDGSPANPLAAGRRARRGRPWGRSGGRLARRRGPPPPGRGACAAGRRGAAGPVGLRPAHQVGAAGRDDRGRRPGGVPRARPRRAGGLRSTWRGSAPARP